MLTAATQAADPVGVAGCAVFVGLVLWGLWSLVRREW